MYNNAISEQDVSTKLLSIDESINAVSNCISYCHLRPPFLNENVRDIFCCNVNRVMQRWTAGAGRKLVGEKYYFCNINGRILHEEDQHFINKVRNGKAFIKAYYFGVAYP